MSNKNANKSFKKRFQEWIYQNLVVILLFTSIILILISYLINSEPYVKSIIEKVGIATLSSGVFAAVLKSIQFTGIFKEEIKKIMLGNNFIENRSTENQIKLWKALSKAIYKRKFPEIGELIESRILNTYLPVKNRHYLRNYVLTVNIDEISDDFIIKYTQTAKYEVVLDKQFNETQIESNITIHEEEGLSVNENKLEFFKVDDKDVEPMKIFNEGEEKNNVRMSVPLIAKGDKYTFKIHSKFSRKYSLRNENFKLFRFNSFTQGVDVTVSYPDDVSVSFFNIGTVNLFESQHTEIKKIICRSHKNDVLLPYQGFGMSFEKIKNNK